MGPSYSHATGRTLAGPARSSGGGGREELGVSVAGYVMQSMMIPGRTVTLPNFDN